MKGCLRLIIALIFSLISTHLFSQQCGVISDKKTKEGIAYVSIIIINKSNGIITDDKGKYCLDIQKNISDSVLISALGYENQRMTFNQLAKFDTIYLKEKRVVLDEVIVKKSKGKTKRLGPFHKKIMIATNSYSPNSNNTIVVKINNEEQLNGFIKTLHFRLGPHKLDFLRKYRMRCRIFKNGGNDDPTEDILSKNVVVDIDPNDKYLNVDIDSLNIPFKEKSLWVGIQTIGYIDNEGKYVALSDNQYGKLGMNKKIRKHEILSPYFIMTNEGTSKISSFYTKSYWMKVGSTNHVPLFGVTIAY
jgi:hypothetical protein